MYMEKATKPEVWLRGPLPNIPPLLQPVAHILMQAQEEVTALMVDFPNHLLWQQPAGCAAPGFHLKHMRGVIDRLFTYAEARLLNPEQLAYLNAEGLDNGETVEELLNGFNQQVDSFLMMIAEIDETTLTDFRGVGRAQLPSTVLGLLVHIAEHTMRHLGQLLVTVRVLKAV
jgi:hypothetical protein